MQMKLYKNFLSEEIHKKLMTVLFSNNFPWFYNNEIVGSDTKNIENDFFFSHILCKDEKSNSNYFNIILDPILQNLKFKKLIRAKINCYTRSEKNRESRFHVDQNKPHVVAIYNLNTCNGYTLFENNVKIFSEKNTLLIFNGEKSHASASQTDEKLRININMNME